MSRSGVRRVSRTIERSRSVRRSRLGRWVGNDMDLDVTAVVVVTEEERVRALPGTEDPAVLAYAASHARPLEADRALLQPLILVAGVAGDTFHRKAEYNRPRAGRSECRRAGGFVVLYVMPVCPEKPDLGGVAQLVRARGSYPRSPGFESLHRHHLFLLRSFLLSGGGGRA